jgi:hypothetical protein
MAMTVHLSEAEVARDLHAALAKVQQGVEIVIELLRAQDRSGRFITEILREAKQRNSTVTLDEDFGKDIEAIVEEHQQPWAPPAWE